MSRLTKGALPKDKHLGGCDREDRDTLAIVADKAVSTYLILPTSIPLPCPRFGEAGKHAPWMTFDQLLSAGPQVIIVMPCGFGIERSRRDMPSLTSRPGWEDLQAVRDGRVFVADGNQFFNRPGPRLVESLEILAEVLHPEQFDFGHENTGWQQL